MIPRATLDELLARLSPPPTLVAELLAARLRTDFPGLHITVCGEDDIPPRLPAAAENAHCRLYYVDGSEHCLRLTTDDEAASGVVVALLDDDE